MAKLRVRRRSLALAVVGLLMVVYPCLALFYDEPVLGYEVEVEDSHENEMKLRPFLTKPNGLARLDEEYRALVTNVTCHVRAGNLTSLDFDFGVREGCKPIDFSSAEFLLSGRTERDIKVERYGLLPGVADRTATYAVLKDPGGNVRRRILDDDAVIRVTLPDIGYTANSEVYLLLSDVYRWGGEYLNLILPPFMTDPPFTGGSWNAVQVDDADGSYPRPSADDWVIRNHTRIEDQTLNVDKRIIILPNGSLELGNVTILVEPTEPPLLFSLPAWISEDLTPRHIPPLLIEEFNARGRELGRDATVSVSGGGYKIHYYNHTKFWDYLLKVNGSVLEVYQGWPGRPATRHGFYVGQGGALSLLGCTLKASREAEEGLDWYQDFELQLHGRARIRDSSLWFAHDTSLDIYSDDVALLDNRVQGRIECLYSSPSITGNSIGTQGYSDGSRIDCTDSSANISQNSLYNARILAGGRSRPLIADNLIANIDTAISTSDFSNPLILNNTFRRCSTGIRMWASYGTVVGNSFEYGNEYGYGNYGIVMEFMSMVTASGNTFNVAQPIISEYGSTADLRGNNFTGYRDYAITSSRSYTSISDNSFTPNSSTTKRTGAVLQEQGTFIKVTTRKRGGDGPQTAGVSIERGPGYGIRQELSAVGKDTYFYTVLKIYEITNDGKKVDHGPHRVVIRNHWWTCTVPVQPEHAPDVEVILSERWWDRYFLGAMMIAGAAILARPAAILAHARYRRHRDAPPGHPVRISLDEAEERAPDIQRGDPRIIRIPFKRQP